MKINESRKSTESIMANRHFGGMTLKQGNVSMYVPETWINKNGTLKRYAKKVWDELIADNRKNVI